jgi:hypothetical protein
VINQLVTLGDKILTIGLFIQKPVIVLTLNLTGGEERRQLGRLRVKIKKLDGIHPWLGDVENDV